MLDVYAVVTCVVSGVIIGLIAGFGFGMYYQFMKTHKKEKELQKGYEQFPTTCPTKRSSCYLEECPDYNHPECPQNPENKKEK